MDVYLHLGAHRTGTTHFQCFLAANRAALLAAGTALWLPGDIRSGGLSGLLHRPGGRARALADLRLARRLERRLARLSAAGLDRLILSDENLLGTMAGCLAAGTPYPDAWGRLRRLDALFSGRVAGVGIALRDPAEWWASMLAFRLPRGGPLPDAALVGRLASQPRGWADVLADIATALPGRRVAAWDFAGLAPRPQHALAQLTGGAVAGRGLARVAHGRNAAPRLPALRAHLARQGAPALPPGLEAGGAGRWMPFAAEDRARLAAGFAADLFRLARGVPGIDFTGSRAVSPGPAHLREGQGHDGQDRSLEGARGTGTA